MPTITEITRAYCLSRELSPGWQHQIEHRCEALCRFLGSDPPIEAVDSDAVNRFLASLKCVWKPETVHGYRACIHAVWMWAYQERLTDTPPARLRRVHVRQHIIRAYTADELRRLYRACDGLTGCIPGTPCPKPIWWRAYVAAAYSTALRRGCLLALERRQIAADGMCCVVACKTGKLTVRRLDKTALAGITAIAARCKTRLAFPRAGSRRLFFREFRYLRILAGVFTGSAKWIRRSAISYAERERPGAGAMLGGHSDERVTVRSYRDLRIAPTPVVEPPRIRW